MKTQINQMVEEIHAQNVAAGWYKNLGYDKAFRALAETGNYGPVEIARVLEIVGIKESHQFNVGEKLALIHSETSEAMEGHRKNLMDDKLPHRPMVEVELADVVIRVMDLAGALKLDLGGAIEEKLSFNKVRPDHKLENRLKDGGKAY